MSKIFYSLTLITSPILSVLISSCGMPVFPGDGGDMEALQQQEEQAVLEDTSEMVKATKWLNIDDNRVQVVMQTQIYRSGQRYTSHEDLIVDYESGPLR